MGGGRRAWTILTTVAGCTTRRPYFPISGSTSRMHDTACYQERPESKDGNKAGRNVCGVDCPNTTESLPEAEATQHKPSNEAIMEAPGKQEKCWDGQDSIDSAHSDQDTVSHSDMNWSIENGFQSRRARGLNTLSCQLATFSTLLRRVLFMIQSIPQANNCSVTVVCMEHGAVTVF